MSVAKAMKASILEIRFNKRTERGLLNERSVDYWIYGILKYSEKIHQPEEVMPVKTKEPEYESVQLS